VNTPVAKARCLGVIGLGTMGYGAAISAQRRGFSTLGLDIVRLISDVLPIPVAKSLAISLH
jgi:UDP-N-acetyl-D-mannosaminuronate dehydrogenase